MGALGAAGAAVGAIGAVVGALAGFVATMQVFVQALAPNVIQQFGIAIRDLMATIGYSAVPMFLILTDAIRQVSGIILPVMQELRPVLEDLTKVFSGILIAQVRLAGVLFFISPLILFFASGLQMAPAPLSLLMDVLTVTVRTFEELITAVFGGKAGVDDVRQATAFFTKIIQQVATGLVILAGSILKFVGLTDTLGTVIKQFQKLRAERAVEARGRAEGRRHLRERDRCGGDRQEPGRGRRDCRGRRECPEDRRRLLQGVHRGAGDDPDRADRPRQADLRQAAGGQGRDPPEGQGGGEPGRGRDHPAGAHDPAGRQHRAKAIEPDRLDGPAGHRDRGQHRGQHVQLRREDRPETEPTELVMVRWPTR